MEEKTLEDFFKESDSKYTRKTKKQKSQKSSVDRNENESWFIELFKNYFSFDKDVNLTNPTEVLYRKNYCIKNIVFLLKLVFILFSFIGISKTNYIITIIFWLIVFGLSQTIKFMLKNKKKDYSHQTIIMYLQCLFVIILSVILYIKVYLGFVFVNGSTELTNSQIAITHSAYFLIYISILVTSLYQDPKLLRVLFFWSLLILTGINLTTIHPDLYDHASSIKELFNYACVENKTIIVDILLRTIVFLVFYACLYSSTSITHFIFEQRKNEFAKRVDVETDFNEVVESVLDVVKIYNMNEDLFEQKISSKRIKNVAREIAVAMNLSPFQIGEIEKEAVVHADKIRELEYDEGNNDYKAVIQKTKLGTEIIKRLQLHRKAEDIVQAVFERTDSNDFRIKMSRGKESMSSNIVLLAEIYDILRSERTYKKALNHIRSLEMISTNFVFYFNSDIIVRFQKFNNEIKEAYEKA